MLISEVIQHLQSVLEESGDLPLAKSDGVCSFEPVTYFDLSTVELMRRKTVSSYEVWDFVAYNTDNPTHVEIIVS